MFSYSTKIRLSLSTLANELPALWDAYRALDPTETLRKTKKADNMYGAEAARSAFSRANNLQKFYDRVVSGEIPSVSLADGTVIIDVVASAKGNSTRIYFKPSITSLTKEVRKAILPLNDENVLIYFDLKAAEFALNQIYAQESEALAEYAKGGDIYMHYANLFPAGTERKVIKKILIANMYGQTAYRVGLDLGISETQAQRLLDRIAASTPKQTMLKRRVMQYDMRNNGYYAPDGFDQTHLIKVADVDPVKGFNPDLACSVYTQSGLGFIMQKFSTKYLQHQGDKQGLFLSVFDSVIAEISKDSVERFEQFITNVFSPLLPDGFHLGQSMFEAMYEEDLD